LKNLNPQIWDGVRYELCREVRDHDVWIGVDDELWDIRDELWDELWREVCIRVRVEVNNL
jgi:hypothetical protein